MVIEASRRATDEKRRNETGRRHPDDQG